MNRPLNQGEKESFKEKIEELKKFTEEASITNSRIMSRCEELIKKFEKVGIEVDDNKRDNYKVREAFQEYGKSRIKLNSLSSVSYYVSPRFFKGIYTFTMTDKKDDGFQYFLDNMRIVGIKTDSFSAYDDSENQRYIQVLLENDSSVILPYSKAWDVLQMDIYSEKSFLITIEDKTLSVFIEYEAE